MSCNLFDLCSLNESKIHIVSKRCIAGCCKCFQQNFMNIWCFKMNNLRFFHEDFDTNLNFPYLQKIRNASWWLSLLLSPRRDSPHHAQQHRAERGVWGLQELTSAHLVLSAAAGNGLEYWFKGFKSIAGSTYSSIFIHAPRNKQQGNSDNYRLWHTRISFRLKGSIMYG